MIDLATISTLTSEEYQQLAEAVRREGERRAILASAPDVVSSMLAAQTTAYLSARDRSGPYADPDAPPAAPEWIQPTGAHDSYPADYTVTHGGKTWVSTAAANVWEPGVYGWAEVAA